jgi:hypothetical protein
MWANGQTKPSHFWLTPVKSLSGASAEQILHTLVQENGIYALGHRAHGRKQIRAGDWICFYIAKQGIVGFARVSSGPEEKIHNLLQNASRYPWIIQLDHIELYLNKPTRFDLETRKQLDAFNGREEASNFGWFVQSTHRISANDFAILTRAPKILSESKHVL